MARTGRPTTLGYNGMVATPHSLASAAGLAALMEGGTAADAVIAANAVLTVIYPDQTAIGGDLFLIYHEAATGTTHALNGTGRAPQAASREALRAAGHTSMPKRGIHAVTVPGTIDAWATISERFGKLGLERLLRPAVSYARDGFPVSPNLAGNLAIARDSPDFDENFRRIYLPGGQVPAAGSKLRLPQLADSLVANLSRTRPELRNDLIAVLKTLQPEFEKRDEQMVTSTARSFAGVMSEQALKDTAAFFRSEAGKAYVAMQPKVIDQMMISLEAWNRQMSEDLTTRVREEMRKKGHAM